jgi:anaphase-promoting complex subunit 11
VLKELQIDNNIKMTRKRSSDTTIIEAGSQSFDNQIRSSASMQSQNLANRPKLRVRIKKYHGVAHWTWNCGDDDEVCGICQSAYEGVAPGAKFPGDECPVVLGKCGHCFHLQCVTTWLSTRQTCPMCRSNWEFGADNSAGDAASS